MSTYNFVVVGAGKVGKTAVCSRIVSHRFDAHYKPSDKNFSFHLRYEFNNEDCFVMLEDTIAIEKASTTDLLKTPWWFESWDEEKLLGEDEEGGESAPLIRKPEPAKTTNPVYERQKRYGAFVVFDLSSKDSFEQACVLIRDIFARAMAFEPNGWKKAPVAVVLVGNKCDLVGRKREVTQSDIDAVMETYSNKIIIERDTKKPRQHIRFLEVSAKHGTNCDKLVPTAMELVKGLPSKRAVMTPDLGDGWYGQLLKDHEWAREVHGVREDVSIVVNRYSRKVKKQLKPIFKMDWLKKSVDSLQKNTIDRLPTINVPENIKVFPRWMLCCFCLRRPKTEDELAAEKEKEKEDEDEASEAEVEEA